MHHDVLGASNADDLLQPGRSARARNLPEPLLRQRVEAGFGDNAKIAGERNLEPDAEAVSAIGGDHRLGAARRRCHVPGELRDMLGRGLEEALDVAAAGEMLADRAQHDDAHTRVVVERFECQAELIALRHLDDVERRAMQDDVGTLLFGIKLDRKAVERRKARVAECHGDHAAVPSELDASGPAAASVSFSASNSPATSLRRSSLPTGDLGTSATKT